jgi:hypothetical protein
MRKLLCEIFCHGNAKTILILTKNVFKAYFTFLAVEEDYSTVLHIATNVKIKAIKTG